MKRFSQHIWAVVVALHILWISPLSAEILHFVYVSDTHYGIKRTFRGVDGVSAREVNRAMITSINTVPEVLLPCDGGVGAGDRVEVVEAVLNTGDITNRMESGVLSAQESWGEFSDDWSSLLTLKSRRGTPSPQYLSAGNHEASNAKGLYKLVMPTDATPMVELYNRMPTDKEPITLDGFDFDRHRVHYSVMMGGVRFLFIALWPDSVERVWIAQELNMGGGDEPVLLFSHDAPKVEVKHLLSPHTEQREEKEYRFESILSDVSSVATTNDFPTQEVDELADFLRSQPRVKAYFHGDDNYHEFYDFKDSKGRSVIPTFRVDSPMKGEISKGDESKLSFMLLSLDTDRLQLTAREVMWNTPTGICWGEVRTIGL